MIKKILQEPIEISRNYPANYSPEHDFFVRDHLGYLTNETRLFEYRNARVSADCVVYDKLIVQKPSLVLTAAWSYYQFNHLVKNILFSRKFNLRSGNYLLVTDHWSSGHFHWFCDILPKLWLIRNDLHHYTLLLQDTEYLRKIGIRSLELLGFRFRDIHFLKPNEFYKIGSMDFISPVTRSGTVDDHIMQEIRGNLVKSPEKGNKKYYISRKDSRFRKVLNEDALIGTLKNYGFEILHTEFLTLDEQISCFSECDVLVGMHGAGLTNSLFMPRNSKLVEFRKEDIPGNHCYWHIADAVGVKYYYYFGIPDSNKPIEGEGCNLTIPTGDFEKKILQLVL